MHDRIDIHFFLDTFFATRMSTNSTIGNTCCQIFVKDKSFLHEETLKKRSYLIYALKSFAKEVGILEATIAYGTPEENSTEIKKFYIHIGT